MLQAPTFAATAVPPAVSVVAPEVGEHIRQPSGTPAGPLAFLPQDARKRFADCHAQRAVPAGYDPADFRRRLAAWVRANPAPTRNDAEAAAAELADLQAVHRVSDDLRSALIAAVTIGMAHSAEMLMSALSTHPLIRLSAVSHPFVLGTLLERLFKKMAQVPDPDPLSRTGARFEEKAIAALVNWNFVQPALDTVLRSPLARSLKVAVTAGINALRDLTERRTTRRKLAELDPAAPDGPRKLTEMESLFINCLMCWLRNVAVDLPRQIIRTQLPEQALPALGGFGERLLRHLVLGSQVPGGLPATAIATQAAFGEVVRGGADGWTPPDDAAGLRLAFQSNNPF